MYGVTPVYDNRVLNELGNIKYTWSCCEYKFRYQHIKKMTELRHVYSIGYMGMREVGKIVKLESFTFEGFKLDRVHRCWKEH